MRKEALLYDGLVAVAAQEGGYELAGWVRIGICLAAAGLASRLPEPVR